MRAFTQTSPRDVALAVILSCVKRGLDSVDLDYIGLREQKRGQSVNRTTLRSPDDPCGSPISNEGVSNPTLAPWQCNSQMNSVWV
jgi:hypothetical protein